MCQTEEWCGTPTQRKRRDRLDIFFSRSLYCLVSSKCLTFLQRNTFNTKAKRVLITTLSYILVLELFRASRKHQNFSEGLLVPALTSLNID